MKAIKHGFEGSPPLYVPVRGTTKAEHDTGQVLVYNMNHCRICRLYHDRRLTSAQYQAASRLQNDYYLSQRGTMRLSDPTRPRGQGHWRGVSDLSDSLLEARRRYLAALAYVGKRGAKLLAAVVIEEQPYQAAAFVFRWNRRAILPALQVALGALAVYYGEDG